MPGVNSVDLGLKGLSESGSEAEYTGKFAEQGTAASGFVEWEGKCGDCIHNPKGELHGGCYHPAVMNDPKLQKRKRPDGSIEVKDHYCCRFANNGEEE